MLEANSTFKTLKRAPSSNTSSAIVTIRPVCLDGGGFVDTPIYDYSALRAGHRVTGPAVIQVPTKSVVVPNGMHGEIDEIGVLTIQTRSNVSQFQPKRSVAG